MPDLATLIAMSRTTIYPLGNMVAWVCWLMGLVFGIRALFQAVKVSVSQGNSREGWGGPIVGFTIGVVLIVMAQAAESFTDSIFGGNVRSVLSYNPPAYSALSAEGIDMVKTILLWCELFGYIAFAKGMIMIRATANGLNPQTYGPGVMFILGGVLAANITMLVSSVAQTLGITAFVG